MNVAALLFDDFETLDVFGPVEILGRLVDLYTVKFYSLNGGQIRNKHNVSILTEKLEQVGNGLEIFLIPGGHGVRQEVENQSLLDKMTQVSNSSKFVLTVC